MGITGRILLFKQCVSGKLQLVLSRSWLNSYRHGAYETTKAV